MLTGDRGSTFEVHAGPHERHQAIVTVPGGRAGGSSTYRLQQLNTAGEVQRDLPAQGAKLLRGTEAQTALTFVLPHLAAGEVAHFRVGEPGSSESDTGVSLREGEGQYDFLLGGELFTSYVVRPEVVRPYCYPVRGPGGVEVTNFAPADHIHHKSLYVAHGAINGYDNWSELEGHARTVNQQCMVVSQGPVYAELLAENDWETPAGEKLLAESTRLRVYNLPEEVRLMDWDITWTAAYGGVFFGDTKEAGTLSVRVAESMEQGKGGRIANAFGAVGESECWGQPAPWVDYSGPVAGRTLGLAIFDYPDNFRYPTPWHVRGYGLFTANCWARHDFTGDWSKRGDYVLPAGQSLHWRFRVYIHEGDEQQGAVAERYLDFAYPPVVST